MGADALFDIAGKTALVTGGASGIGRFIAEGFVRAGVKVYLSSRDAAAGERTARELSDLGTCISLPFDLLSLADITRLSADLLEQEPRLHILVNNSGAFRRADFEDHPEDAWDDVMDLNVRTPFFLTQKLLPGLRAASTTSDPARVLNISSIAGSRAYDNNNISYQTSKAALNHLTRALGARLARENITVNAIAPGPMAGGMMVRTTTDEAFRQEMERTIPLGRLGQAEDLAGVANFLCSRASAYLTGVIVPLDGGASTCR